MSRAHESFKALYEAFVALHGAEQVLQEFCALDPAPERLEVEPHHMPAAEMMKAETGLFTTLYAELRDAFLAASPHAHWRETYKGTRLEGDFLERFGCYCLIGDGGAFHSERIAAYMVYMPAGLYYPFHHHPAEEMYFILAGEAEFMLEGEAPKTLGPGDHVFHPSNRPHATETHEHPFMALVWWRGDMSQKPVLTYPEGNR